MLILVDKLKWIKSQFSQLKTGDKKTLIHKILTNFNCRFLLIDVDARLCSVKDLRWHFNRPTSHGTHANDWCYWTLWQRGALGPSA